MGIRIALDAGHGLYTAGKRCLKSIDPNETREWSLNSRVVEKVMSLLSKYKNVDIVRVDDPTGKTDVQLKTRCKIANEAKADLYLSFHHNAGANGTNAGGITVYTYQGTVHTFQKRLYSKLIEKTSLKGNRASWDIKARYYVLQYTNMPSCLMELGFMDSNIDTPIILTDQFANQCAEAVVEFLVDEYMLELKASKLYRVQVGAYTKQENAKLMQEKLKTLGYESIIV